MTTSIPVTQNVSYKSLLQEYSQKHRLQFLPRYFVDEEESFPSPQFFATVMVDGQTFTCPEPSRNKKHAEQNAAKIACERLGLCRPHNAADVFGTGDDTPYPKVQVGERAPKPFGIAPIVSKAEESISNNSLGAMHALPGEPVDLIVVESMEDVFRDTPPQQLSSSFKSLLNERAQREGTDPPTYVTEPVDGNNLNGFVSVVTYLGKLYESNGVMRSKKMAEQSAAEACLRAINGLPGISESDEPFIKPHPIELEVNFDRPAKGVLTSFDEKPKSCNYKSLLQEHLQQRGMQAPTYTTAMKEEGYISTCCFEGKQFDTEDIIPNRKGAEQQAALDALNYLGITDPEEIFKIKNDLQSKKFRRKTGKGFGRPDDFNPTLKSTWIHTRWEDNDISFSEDVTDDDPTCFDFEQNERKVEKEEEIRKFLEADTCVEEDDPFSVWTKMEPKFFNVPIKSMKDISVGEIWPEKKNLLLVGNTSFSIPMQCHGNKRKLYCTKTETSVEIKPGANLRGLICKYHLRHGRIYFKAKSCDEILYPDELLPVLLSCGVVFLYFNPHVSQPTQVLLKRYMNSPAFVNVQACLAQYFRRQVSGRPLPLDITSITENIRQWMTSEVVNLAVMSEDSIRRVFAYMWRFNERWGDVLKDTQLPKDLCKLQATCQEEIKRRKASRHSSMDDDSYRPWNLPKGNFKHRLLSTGIFLESSAECAFRELKEETGMMIRLSDVEESPYVDLYNTDKDNLNPHQGDFCRYYIYQYKVEKPTEKGKEEEGEIVEDKDLPEIGKFKTDDEMDNSETKGSKRKRDGEGEEEEEADVEKKEQGSRDSSKRKKKSRTRDRDRDRSKDRRYRRDRRDTDDKDDTTKRPPREEPSVIKLNPAASVRTTIHEECAWFPIKEARKKSPLFELIYKTKGFQYVLDELRNSENQMYEDM